MLVVWCYITYMLCQIRCCHACLTSAHLNVPIMLYNMLYKTGQAGLISARLNSQNTLHTKFYSMIYNTCNTTHMSYCITGYTWLWTLHNTRLLYNTLNKIKSCYITFKVFTTPCYMTYYIAEKTICNIWFNTLKCQITCPITGGKLGPVLGTLYTTWYASLFLSCNPFCFMYACYVILKSLTSP